MLARLEQEAQLAQRLDHLDPERADARVHAVAEFARGAHDDVAIPAAHHRKRVLHR